MSKKPINMRFEADLIARVDAASERLGIDRTALFTQAVERALDECDRGPEPWRKARTGGNVTPSGPIHIVGEKPSEQMVKRGTIQTGPTSILDGLDIADAPRRPAPGSMLKKGK